MNPYLTIGITCYPSVGGSGIVATNLGNDLARLGHHVHFISYEPPFRLNLKQPNVFFHQVPIHEYDLFKYPDYTLPLAVQMGRIHTQFHLDILHVHYAIPHATAAILARDMLEMQGVAPPHVVTTLHGTDITLVGRDPAITPIVRYSIDRSNFVTAVSNYLKQETYRIIQTTNHIEVIYNFYHRAAPLVTREEVRKELEIEEDDVLAVHSSNLRPVKRIPDLLKIVAALKERENFKLLILAGNDFAPFQPLVEDLDIGRKVRVREKILDIDTYLAAADIGLYPSQDETFGMGILESMCHGHAVVASKAGGILEVVEDGTSGLLCPVGQVDDFAGAIEELIRNPRRRQWIGEQAKQRAQEAFSPQRIVTQYVDQYRKLLKN